MRPKRKVQILAALAAVCAAAGCTPKRKPEGPEKPRLVSSGDWVPWERGGEIQPIPKRKPVSPEKATPPPAPIKPQPESKPKPKPQPEVEKVPPADEPPPEPRARKRARFRDHWHPWFSAESAWYGSRVSVGVPIYDDPEIGAGLAYEVGIYHALPPPVSVGLSFGQSVVGNDDTKALNRGYVQTAQVMLNARLDIPLGRKWAPVVSLAAGVGGLHVDSKPSSNLKNELEDAGLKLERDTVWMLDTRVRADLLIPLGKKRNYFLILGVVRDHAKGDMEYRHVDRATGDTVFRKRDNMSFNRTTFILGGALYF